MQAEGILLKLFTSQFNILNMKYANENGLERNLIIVRSEQG